MQTAATPPTDDCLHTSSPHTFPFLAPPGTFIFSVLLLYLAAWLSASKVMYLSKGSMLSVLVWLQYFILGNSICIFFQCVFVLFIFHFPFSSHAQLHQTPSLSNKSNSIFHVIFLFSASSGPPLHPLPIVLWKRLCAPSLHTYKMSTPLKLWNIQITAGAKDTELNLFCHGGWICPLPT